MDPFAPDSDAEEEGTSVRLAGPSQRTQNGTEHTARQHSSTDPGDEDLEAPLGEDDDDEPPPSIVLNAQRDNARSQGKSDKVYNIPGNFQLQREAQSEAGPSHLRESVKLDDLNRSRKSPSIYQDDDVQGSIEDEEGDMGERDEEVGLMDHLSRPTSSASSSSSTRRKRERGFFQTITHKVRKRTKRMQAENDLLGGRNATRSLNPRERALWEWGTLQDMDEFLQEVYAYYNGKGLFCIALTKVLNLLTIAFVIGFSTFLVGCVDYSQIKHDGKLSDVIVDRCFSRFSGLSFFALVAFVLAYGLQVVRFGLGFSKLVAMSRFYGHLLNIPDADVQSIPWHEVVSRLSHLRQTYPNTSISSSRGGIPSTESNLDAHDVANRIMRQENYLVALFNKDILNLNLPFFGLQSRPPQLTKTLEWNLAFCLLGFLFDSKGQVRKEFLTERHRMDLIEGLKRRFIFMAIVNAVFAPFIVLYLLFYSFFRYFEEYHKNPSTLGSRQYTQFARWKFREFNELPHLFRRRCHNSYPFAQRYIDQYPKERVAIVARFVSFVAGSFTAVLLLASVVDPDLFIHFDISHQRNVLFYIGVFGAITAVSRGLMPDEQQVFEPDVLLRGVIEHTHYLPEQWKGRFHSAEVHAEFGSMYKMKIYIFLSEIMSVIITPFILWKSLPTSAPSIIDFFREFTVHVDGLGYVCSFAIFDFQRHGNAKFGAPEGIRDERLSSKEGKMEQSLLGFRAANPTWQPSDPSASLFLSRLASFDPSSPRARGTGSGEVLPPPSRAVGHASHGTNISNNMVTFTPASSTLAQRSQLYNDAFERSISYATKPSNAMALQASAIKTGSRSVAAKTLQAVNEDDNTEERQGSEVDEDFDPDSHSAYEDARPDVQRLQQQSSVEMKSQDEVNLRGLLQHIGSRW
ncbi:hypothetical protein CBS101457_001430 [Exobasidium rhododendri]|nr:hypothetical protein CBS101457_001430 [Exobasidium rhododendri]